MWVIAGLGNPGRKYSKTRHNIGFMVIDECASRYRTALIERKEYRIGKSALDGHPLLLLEPLRYMNICGPVIKKVLTRHSLLPEHLIVIHDDLDMTPGALRIRRRGSAGGHKGVESIIQNLGTLDFIRLKIGIGRNESMPFEEYVLRNFSAQEMKIMKEAIVHAGEAIRSIILEGVDAAMNRFN